jgi:hypothetical protein
MGFERNIYFKQDNIDGSLFCIHMYVLWSAENLSFSTSFFHIGFQIIKSCYLGNRKCLFCSKFSFGRVINIF